MLFVDISQITVFCNKRNKNILTYFVISCQFFKTLKNSSFEELGTDARNRPRSEDATQTERINIPRTVYVINCSGAIMVTIRHRATAPAF